MSEVEVPKVGPVKKQYVIGAGVLVGGYVLWRYWQASQAAAAPAPAPESAGTIGADIGSGAGGYYDPNDPSGIGGNSNVGDVMTTDAQWYERAVLVLENAGFDTGAGALALGKYLRSEPLTPAEQNMVTVALAGAGNPPSGAKGIITDTAPSPSGLTAPQHLRQDGASAYTSVRLIWDPVSGASDYVVWRGYTQIATVRNPGYTVTGLTPGAAYTYTVRAKNTGGSLSAPSAPLTVHTAKPSGPVMSGGTAVKVAPKASGETAKPVTPLVMANKK